MTEAVSGPPVLRQVVLDSTDARGLAEFWRQLLGLTYRPGDGPGEADPDADFLVIRGDGWRLAFQQVDALAPATWPDGPRPQQLHLDLTVDSRAQLDRVDERVRGLGATLLEDRSQDPEEPLRVYADPAGHPFCVFFGPPPA